jgi:hypothetical protein
LSNCGFWIASSRAVSAVELSYSELLNEYRMALSLWSEARAVYSSDEPEVIAATKRVEALEEELSFYNKSPISV